MYFDSYYLTSLRFINDISLMNFSNRLAGLLYISSFRFLCFVQVLMFLVSVSITATFQSCYSYYQTPLQSFLKLFFSFYFSVRLNTFKELPISTLNYSNHPSLYPFHCFPSSEAGCKSRKII
jgi:hypothetical protein